VIERGDDAVTRFHEVAPLSDFDTQINEPANDC
jgi:hypothetical protein